jgi:hypothetical protein
MQVRDVAESVSHCSKCGVRAVRPVVWRAEMCCYRHRQTVPAGVRRRDVVVACRDAQRTVLL